jgi:tRNA (guanine37-N1)-methyltransferase
MKFCVLTLFPDMIRQAAGTSILGRAASNGYIEVNTINIRDFSTNKHNRVDDYPYGGGAGMVIEAEPVFRAVEAAKRKTGENAKVIYMTPQAKVLDQTKVEELAMEDSLILLCGHYEGIDDRVLQEVVDDYISIGDYVLTGGELGALVLMDAVSRFVPGVLSNDESSQFESLQDNLLEYPHYTRPEIWHDKKVDSVLLSGDHKKINAWRYEQSVIRTKERRPDLLKNSYNVKVVSFGSESCLETAQKYCGIISRYGTVMDYNRNKLIKQKKIFAKKDLVVFVCDSAEKLKEENLSEITFKMSGNNTPAFLIDISSEDGENTERNEKIMGLFKEKGIELIRIYEINDPADEKIPGETALDMRSVMNERAKRCRYE